MSGGRSAEPGFMTALSPSDRWSCEELVARVGGGDCGAPFFRFAAGDAYWGRAPHIAVRNTPENKPPGPKALRAGWDTLAAIATGCHLAVIP
jgi:hypothetical protein